MNKTIGSKISDLRDLLKALLPQKKDERFLFLILLLIYLSYSICIALSTSIIDSLSYETDIYFSYDNPLILKLGRTQISGHPLLMLFYYPFVLIGNGLTYLITFKAKTLLFVLLSSTMISMSCVYIFRYLREIIEVKRLVAYLMTFFFAFFSTNLLLCFTPESFTLSAMFLAFNVYYNSSYINKDKSPPFLSNIILADFILGGITLTNVAKGVVPVLFFKEKKINILKKVVLLGIIFLAILCLVQVISIVFLSKNFLESIFMHRESFTNSALGGSSFFQMVFSHFFGSTIFFPPMMNYTAYNSTMQYIIEGNYSYWWQYAFVALILVAILASLLKNYRNPFVQMIFFLFLIDIIIHCLMKFGINQPFIYGAHWVYCIPLLLGWLYSKLKEKQAKVFVVFLICMFIGLIINNLYHLTDFINMAQSLYPTE